MTEHGTGDEGRLASARQLLWWLPPVVLFAAGALCDPERLGLFRSGSHAYAVLTNVSGSCYLLGIIYIPAMILFRLARSALRCFRHR